MSRVIKVENLSKKYRISHQVSDGYLTLRDSLARSVKSIFKKRTGDASKVFFQEDFWALDDVSFEVNQGERLGIIGRNGAGKSTLLKILSRIVDPTNGRVMLKGRVASLLEVGTGFHPELSGRENIFLNGAILGLKRSEIKSKIKDIVEFSEIDNFIDTPVKRYSSGMYVKLAFAVAAHLDSDILIVDEVLAVGDARFQKKCLSKMGEIADDGRTVLFVSHNMQAVSALCKNAILLNKGKIEYKGPVIGAIDRYLGVSDTFSKDTMQWVAPAKETPFSDIVKIHKYYIVDDSGQIPEGQLYSSRKYNVVIEAEIFKHEPNLAFYLSCFSENETLIFVSDIHDTGGDIAKKLEPGTKTIKMEVPSSILANRMYQLELSCVIHYKGWAMLPDSANRLKFIFNRDVNPNLMGYDEANHPLSGSAKPGLLNPIIKWNVD